MTRQPFCLQPAAERPPGDLVEAGLTGQGSRLFQGNLPQGWQIEEWLVLKGIYYSCRASEVRSQESE